MLYTFAGTSVTKSKLNIRFANSAARATQLAKLGDTAINIVELPSAMDKASAVAHLLSLPAFADVQVVAALDAVFDLAKAKPARTVKVRVTRAKVKAVKSRARVVKAPVIVTREEIDALMMAVYGTK